LKRRLLKYRVLGYKALGYKTLVRNKVPACKAVLTALATVFCWSLIVAPTAAQTLIQSAFDSATFNAAKKTVEIIRVTPTGANVSTSNRQVVFKFNQPMVPVGQYEVREEGVPIEFSPALQCQWRWLDNSSLSCQLNRDDRLKRATEYNITVYAGLSADGGAKLSSTQQHSFTTKRPAVQGIYLEDWRDADKPVALVTFNQAVTKSSVLKALKFVANNGKYASDIVVPDDWNSLQDSVYLKYPGQSDFSLQPSLHHQPDNAAKQAQLSERATAIEQAREVWRISLAKALPENTSINIAVTSGLFGIEGELPAYKNARLHQFVSLPRFEFRGLECQFASEWETSVLPPKFPSTKILRDPTSGDELTPACDPQHRIELLFSTPVSYKSAGDFISFTPDLSGGNEDYDPWATRDSEYYVDSFLRNRFNYGLTQPFKLWLPEALKAYDQYSVTSTSELQDELGRTLTVPMDMAFLTAHRKPNLSLDHQHSVLESGVDSEVPIYVTNLNKVDVENYTITTADSHSGPYSFSKPLATVEDIAYRAPLGVRGLLNGQSGLVVGRLNPNPTVSRYDRDIKPTFVSQVTPFQVHVKLGHFNSYAWVTDMVTGLPVANAQVSIELDHLRKVRPLQEVDNVNLTDLQGLVELPGLLEIDPDLKHYYRRRGVDRHWFVKIRKDQDVAFVPILNNYSAYSQLWPTLVEKDGYMHTWGTTAQGIYKAGDTIQYKLYVRGHSNQHWIAPPKGRYDLQIIDPKGQVVEDLKDIQLNDFGAFDAELAINKTAAVGWYDFRLQFDNDIANYTYSPMQVLVSDFTPSPFKAGNDLNGDQFQPGDRLRVSSYAKLHAGGPYANAQARVTATLTPKLFHSDHPQAQGFEFSRSSGPAQTLHQSQSELNQQGELSTEFNIGDSSALFGSVSVETAVRDERGKYVVGRSSAQFLGRDRFIGLKQTSWVQQVGKAAKVQHLVVNTTGEPIAGTDVELVVDYQVTRAARVKGAGNAYLTQHVQSWVELSRCQQVSASKPNTCEFTPSQPGYHRVTAKITDSQGRQVEHHLYTWAVGQGVLIWNDGGSNHVDIIPDKTKYSVGDVARFLIKNPYPGAQALITTERYGVLSTRQQRLDGSTPIIEVPIKQDDYPGFYLSVVVTSPRVDKPLGEGDVDLGKPAFKMGYANVEVQDDTKQIDVKVRSNKKVYKPRDTVTVSVKAKPKTGKRKPMELAVVVLDEAVFDLNSKGKSYYDPYQGFNKLDSLGVANYNLLLRLVGRQRFEKKGANPGGGGGSDDNASLRNLLKFVAYWNPSIELDKAGKAKFDFELPDNLTGWRVLAMVVDKEERMGLGDANFKVNRPTEIRPIMPNQLTAGDEVRAGFSVMNRTDKRRKLSVELRASGSALVTPVNKTASLELEPFERQQVWLPLKADNAGELAFFAKAGDNKDRDALEHHLQVKPRYVIQTQATYGTSTSAVLNERVRLPDDIIPEVGGVSVDVSPSVIGNISGAFRYLRDYPYACWEQRLSKGVAAAQYQKLKPYLSEDLTWSNSETLGQTTLEIAAQFQAPNGGMAYWLNRNEYVSPYLSAYTAMAFVWMREQGLKVPEQVEQKLHTYLKAYLRRGDVQQVFDTQLSIRAVALAALAARGKVDKSELARYEPHLSNMDLFAKAHFLQAAKSVEAGDEQLSAISNVILSQAVQSGGKFTFQEEASVGADSMLSSSVRSNCAVLSALLDVSGTSKAVFSLLGDIPFKQVRSITQTRGNRDYWENTQENVFCMNALLDFSQVYENETPDMTVSSVFDVNGKITQLGRAQFTSVRDPAVSLSAEQIVIRPDLQGELNINKQGDGRYYYSLRTAFAKTDEAAKSVNAGIEVRREYAVQRNGQWQTLSTPMQLDKGELVRVDLYLSTAGPRNYVVVDDPVPGGLEPVNRDLATTSSIDADQASHIRPIDSWFHQHDDWRAYGGYGQSFYHQELRHDSARFYSDYLPAGNYHLSYTAQAIAGGSFAVKPLKVEEMYDPDVFGLGVPARLNVQ